MFRRSFHEASSGRSKLSRGIARAALYAGLGSASLALPLTAWAQAPQPEGPASIPSAADVPTTDQTAEDAAASERSESARAGGASPKSGGRPLEPEAAPYLEKLETDVGGGLILLYAQPLRKGYKNNFEIFEARLRLDAKYGRFRLHVTPRFRNTLERDFFIGPSWVEEGYLGAEFGPIIVKVGKVYRQFGRFWDNSFMGNVQEYDGLKLDMNHGISIEGVLAEKEPMGLSFALQYFIVDGTTNYSLPGRDTLSIPGARRRNQLVARVEPFIKLGSDMTLKAGLSGEYFQADLPAPVGKQDVARVAIDATFLMGGLAAWVEYTHQFGRHVIGFPIAAPSGDIDDVGQSSNQINYYLLGGEYTYDRYTARYNFSMGDYRQTDVKETRHVPGIQAKVNEYMMVLLEYNRVTHHFPNSKSLLDSGLYLTLHGKF